VNSSPQPARQNTTAIRVEDPLYGTVTLATPVLIDLYHSHAVQRLAHIYQAGITAFINPVRSTTRLDHSMGVVALLQRFGAHPVEQAAGLIHDVPHTAFSHVVDFVFPNHEHDYHEQQRERVLAASDLPEVFARHRLDWRFVAEAENFSLLEQPLPALCADRLDYFLRDAVTLRLATVAEVREVLAHLGVWNHRIVANDLDAARWLADRYLQTDDRLWCSIQEVGWYAVMARALKTALDGGIITEQDLQSTDQEIMSRLRAARHPEIHRWLDLLRLDVQFVRDDSQPDLVALPKVRTIDPPVLSHGQVRPLSELDPVFLQRRIEYIASKQGQWRLRIETRQ
jgi:hypothetical protein